MIGGRIGLGYIKARFCQNPRLTYAILRERERDCQRAAKLVPCPHLTVSSCAIISLVMDRLGLLQLAGRGNGGFVLVGDLAGAATGGFNGSHNSH